MKSIRQTPRINPLAAGSNNMAEQIKIQQRRSKLPLPFSLNKPSEAMQTQPEAPKKKRKVSDVWNHYTKLQQGGTVKAICTHCQAALSAQTSSGTNHLWRHFKRCHPGQEGKQTKLSFPSSSSASLHPAPARTDPDLQKKLLDALVLNQSPFQVLHHQHFQPLLDAFFRPLSQTPHIYQSIDLSQASINQFKAHKNTIAQLLHHHPSQLAVSIEPWTSQRSTHYIKLSAHFIHPSTWKPNKIILAFKPILDPQDPLNELQLATCICEILQEWKIIDKCASITTESSPTNDLAILRVKNFIKDQHTSTDQLRPKPTQDFYFHINCTTFLINETVRELLKNHQEIISKLRKIINFLTFTELKKKMLEHLGKTFGLITSQNDPSQVNNNNNNSDVLNNNNNKKNNKSIPLLDFPNHWDSTFSMISNSIHFKPVFDHLQFNDPHFPQHALSLSDWNQLKNLSQTLEVFYNATCRLSSTDTSTAANEVYVNMRRIETELKNKLCQDDAATDQNNLNQPAENYTTTTNSKNNSTTFAMLENIMKNHWNDKENLKELSQICSIFDPRMKFDYLKFSLFNQFGLNSNFLIDNLRSRIYTIYQQFYQALMETQASNSQAVSGTKIDEVESIIPVNPRSEAEGTSEGKQEEPGEGSNTKEEDQDEFEHYLTNHQSPTRTTTNDQLEKTNSFFSNNNSWIMAELDLYLLEPTLRTTPANNLDLIHCFDVLEWWKCNQFRFPNLSKFVLNLLAIPVSSRDPQFRFCFDHDNEARQLNLFQSGLEDLDFLESLICNRDWIINNPIPSSLPNTTTTTTNTNNSTLPIPTNL